MSTSFELKPVSRITAGAVGEPGQRIFFIQARHGDTLVTLLAEKQQVQVLSDTLTQLLEAMGDAGQEGTPPAGDDLELEHPLLPEWRVGPMAIEVDEDTGLIVLVANEAVPGVEDDEAEELEAGEVDDEEDDAVDEIDADEIGEGDIGDVEQYPPAIARFHATPAQMRALAEHAAVICAAGRPRCQLCGFPIDPDGHTCPAQNGHRKLDV